METAVVASLVSVIMPAYNHEEYVAAAIDSVLVQTWSDIELIIIDDASTDRTWEVISGYTDSRIRASRHTSNHGADVTLNQALDMARGEYLAIINSDDLYAPARIAACLDYLKVNDADLVGTDIALIDSAGNAVSDHWWISAFDGLKSVYSETGDWYATLLEGNVFMTTSNFVFRRSWLQAVGPFLDYRYVLDYEWLLHGLTEGQRLVWLDAPLLQYRLHESNTISEKPLAANQECAAMLRFRLPRLLGANSLERLRLQHLVSQWERIERYQGEIWATLRHEALVAKEAELLPLLADLNRQVAESEQLLVRHVAWIADRDRWIAERDGWISERDGWIADRDARVLALENALVSCGNEKTRLENSISFRIGRALTSPARWLRSVLARPR
jgi:glycosyltransferase involved in cell wall biosynthesis